MSNRILFELAAKDGISPVLRSLDRQARQTQKAVTNANRILRFQNFQQTGEWKLPGANRGGFWGRIFNTSIIGGAVGGAIAGIVSSGISAVTGAARSLVSAFVSGVQDAAEKQTTEV